MFTLEKECQIKERTTRNFDCHHRVDQLSASTDVMKTQILMRMRKFNLMWLNHLR